MRTSSRPPRHVELRPVPVLRTGLRLLHLRTGGTGQHQQAWRADRGRFCGSHGNLRWSTVWTARGPVPIAGGASVVPATTDGGNTKRSMVRLRSGPSRQDHTATPPNTGHSRVGISISTGEPRIVIRAAQRGDASWPTGAKTTSKPSENATGNGKRTPADAEPKAPSPFRR